MKNNLWRSAGELNGSKEYVDFSQREFQEGASELSGDFSRRKFLKLMGASLGLAGVSGCSIRKPKQKIFPYTERPEYLIPGVSRYYSTVFFDGVDSVGLLGENYDGRPAKVEGNPLHPSSGGKLTSYHQASILSLYHPDRLGKPLKKIASEFKTAQLGDFDSFVKDWYKQSRLNSGADTVVLTSFTPSLTLADNLRRLKRRFPKLTLINYDPVNNDAELAGIKAVVGTELTPNYKFANADVVVSFGADFLASGFGKVSDVNGFSQRRDPDGKYGMNRLYTYESNFTLTGSKSDHRYKVNEFSIKDYLIKLSAILIKDGLDIGDARLEKVILNKNKSVKSDLDYSSLNVVAEDLLKAKGRSVILVGNSQDSELHGLVYVLNSALKANGSTIDYVQGRYAKDYYTTHNSVDSIKTLSELVSKKIVKNLFIIGGDPVYNAPVDFNFIEIVKSVDNVLHLTDVFNHTSEAANWVLPRYSSYESWMDLESSNGSLAIMQPMIQPIVEGFSPLTFVLKLIRLNISDYAAVRRTYRKFNVGDFESNWKRSLHDGVVKSVSPKLVNNKKINQKFYLTFNKIKFDSYQNELLFTPDYSVYDGRYAGISWMQECPDPITKLTWDNALIMNPSTAKKNNVAEGDLVEVKTNIYNTKAAVFVLPGVADNTFVFPLGYGQSISDQISKSVGFNAYKLRESISKDYVGNVELSNTGEKYSFATTQNHGATDGGSLMGRPHIKSVDQSYYKSHNGIPHVKHHTSKNQLVSSHKFEGPYQWGMVIDLSKCTGCNACVVACQSENNIPVVGKDEVMNGREMHWIRVDRYFEGDQENPEVLQQPMTCLHCENAPCEQVCPVAATVHDEEGNNNMVYNRCIGTRYCSDNCPTKVRRFNFYDYHRRHTHSYAKKREHLFDYFREPDKKLQMQFNPNVSVRMRGVMEKCTYCIQRVNQAKITVKNEKRELKDGEILTACQQTCPADAIVFGNIYDKKTEVYKLTKKNKRNYELLVELKLKSRTTYLANMTNKNDKLVTENSQTHGDKHV